MALQVRGWTQGRRFFSVKKIVAKSKEENNGPNLAESSKGGHGSKRDVLPMMIMMMLNTNSDYLPSNDCMVVNNELEISEN
jgi:hypothetical protein